MAMGGITMSDLFPFYVAKIIERCPLSNSLQKNNMIDNKYCLKWNDFQENVRTVFGNLREDKDFSDVTLASEDGQQFEAHKVILAASSPFFQNLLERNKHAHPIIYMRGTKSEDLSAIVDFLFFGEANVLQENLESFLAIAGDLKLKRLMGQMGQNNESKENVDTTEPVQVKLTSNVKEEEIGVNSSKVGRFDSEERTFNTKVANQQKLLAIPNQTSKELEVLDEQVKCMMEKTQNSTLDGSKKAYVCKVCGKEGHNVNIRDHIEVNHLEGVSLPCNNCEKKFRSRVSLRKHKCENVINIKCLIRSRLT